MTFIDSHAEHLPRDCIVTDVGSVKGSIVDELVPRVSATGARFIGSHPMAGNEQVGLDAARPDIYDHAIVFITPRADDDDGLTRLIGEFWESIGGVPVVLPSDRHDRTVAHSSHLLHLVAAAAVKCVLTHGEPETQQLAAAGGFRDTTRIASSSVEVWRDICRHNRAAILEALDTFDAEMRDIRRALAEGDDDAVGEFLAAGKALRDEWLRTRGRERGYTATTSAAESPEHE